MLRAIIHWLNIYILINKYGTNKTNWFKINTDYVFCNVYILYIWIKIAYMCITSMNWYIVTTITCHLSWWLQNFCRQPTVPLHHQLPVLTSFLSAATIIAITSTTWTIYSLHSHRLLVPHQGGVTVIQRQHHLHP